CQDHQVSNACSTAASATVSLERKGRRKPAFFFVCVLTECKLGAAMQLPMQREIRENRAPAPLITLC
ncbi:hypothetical protein, partial [Xanthomonas phaseoli]|uniref:hypothetical protein n=1 Tax=Xanthomonas phaseoli TaxID=1985254 RepID=UPI001ED979B1